MDKIKFEVILRRENKKIFNYLLKILRNREDAEDILQETFVAFYKKMNNIDDLTCTSYLFRTAHNKALNLIKSKKRKDKFSITIENMDQVEEKSTQSSSGKNNLVKEALRELNPQQALLIELQFYQKMSYKQIAEVLETTVSAVDSKLVRAKKKLKKNLERKKKSQENESKIVILK
ncbi:MAG: sigma-70 family RNA polymerase sigma factor [Candidatus Cloacimonetes bacterium]|nr:sigma-70 family RNA polymerase sigma factor [Candidatus Cloacimonadota bacterium]